MDAEVPRTLGNLEDAEPERRPAGRSNANKKPLDVFLQEFEERLREHPGEAATSAGAALQGRAEGSWRTPVDGGEPARRLPRHAAWRRPDAEPGPMEAEPAEAENPAPLVTTSAELEPGDDAVLPPTRDQPDPARPPGPEPDRGPQREPEPGPTAEAIATPEGPATGAAAAAAPKRRNRHRRRHHR